MTELDEAELYQKQLWSVVEMALDAHISQRPKIIERLEQVVLGYHCPDEDELADDICDDVEIIETQQSKKMKLEDDKIQTQLLLEKQKQREMQKKNEEFEKMLNSMKPKNSRYNKDSYH